MNGSMWQFLFTLVSIISPLLVFIACCLYINKIVRADSVLMCIGSGITLLLSVMYQFVMPYLIQDRAMPVGEVSFYYSVLGMISFSGGVCFAIGLFMLINNMVNANKLLNGKF
ncbi:hypothetical protein GJU39_04655 [Pedobacter petrophilus]|uniref:Uncharacterized protein n=1 Tax=Pedobacter petrophilus TaxID=1908241 RepID=A0A7K0FUT6_9SPHI|nr:hypothetical protein [Pedobacter petrophilus]MRX75373.1 hypothetical protein [Pedobacter petrophilus]